MFIVYLHNILTGATSRAGIAYPSGAPEFTPVFSGVRVTRSLLFCICFVDRCLSFCTLQKNQVIWYKYVFFTVLFDKTKAIKRE
jgi:hypothetical protein